jgi:tetrapyrrole methylase family protein/MazG family protein
MSGASFEKLYGIIRKLRGPDGCPWDKEQTPQSLRGALIEESYECIEAIDDGDAAHVREELGDLFLLAAMLSFMFEEEGRFTTGDVLEGVSEKLVRRHPHVFGDERAGSAAEVLRNWERIKVEKEGRKPKDSCLDTVSRTLPPLERAYKLQKRAAKAGFDWPSVEGVCAKLEEEYGETRAEMTRDGGKATAALEGELGDLLFSVVNLSRYLGVDPSAALARTNAKFCRRFQFVEKRVGGADLETGALPLETLDAYWREAKRAGL